jgi:hypothetical protein
MDIPLTPSAIDAVLATCAVTFTQFIPLDPKAPKPEYLVETWIAESPAAPFNGSGETHTAALAAFRDSLPFQWERINWQLIAA